MSVNMNEKKAESYLGACYLATGIFSTISIVSLVVAWQHWSSTLGVCGHVDCGCILYGVNTFSTFLGGDVKICHFGTYGLTPVFICGLCLGIYHAYRSCIAKGLDEPQVHLGLAGLVGRHQRRPDNRNLMMNGAVVVVRSKQRQPCKQWMLACCLAAVLAFLSLAHAVVLTDGYYKTCEQYRRNLVKLLGSRGREIQVIHNRLSCGAIFDFMDYLTPDANNWRRGEEINTGLALQLAIATTWLNFSVWILIITINFIMAKRRRVNTLGEKLCCCF